MSDSLRTMRAIFRAGLAAAQRDGDMARAELYRACLRNVAHKAKEQKP